MIADKNLQAWSFKNTVDFYVRERTRAADLYESESSMLLPVLPHVKSVLDVGCAVGNFCLIWRELNPQISYAGIDTSEGMIKQARKQHPGETFYLGNERELPFANNSFDMVFCTGVLNHNPDYLDLIAEMLRVARRFAVIDLPRLVTQPYKFDLASSYMVLRNRFPTENEGITEEASKVPYVLANVKETFGVLVNRFLEGLAGFACCGYYGKPHKSVTIPYSPIIFTVILLVKGKGPVRYCLRLPDDALPIAEAMFPSAKCAKVESVEAVLAGCSS